MRIGCEFDAGWMRIGQCMPAHVCVSVRLAWLACVACFEKVKRDEAGSGARKPGPWNRDLPRGSDGRAGVHRLAAEAIEGDEVEIEQRFRRGNLVPGLRDECAHGLYERVAGLAVDAAGHGD